MGNPTRGKGILESFLARKRAGIADKLIPSSHRGGRILDIGCGMHPLFLSITEFQQKYAIDKTVTEGNAIFQDYKIRMLNHDIESGGRLPFEDEYFDAVSMLAVLEHIEPLLLTGILKEIYRVLKKPGVYVLTTPALWTHNLLRVMALVNLVSPDEIKEHKAAYNPRIISSLLREALFPSGKIATGYFEMFMNIWAKAEK